MYIEDRMMPEAKRISLSDGTPVLFRPVIPSDRLGLQQGVREMSRTSRYMRFLAGVRELTEEQLDYFTKVDQDRHVAWCAVEPEQGQRGYGLGRFICHDDQTASFALAVIDDLQGKGLGTLLLAKLCIEAASRGIKRLRSEVLLENPVMPQWIPKLGGYVEFSAELGVHEVHLPIPPDFKTRSGMKLKRWMDRLLEY